LKLGESLHIKEIALPSGVMIIENPEKVVLSIIHKLKVKVEVAAEVTEEVAEPEVLAQKGAPKEENK
jgi:large subunit ribosomal protein L25